MCKLYRVLETRQEELDKKEEQLRLIESVLAVYRGGKEAKYPWQQTNERNNECKTLYSPHGCSPSNLLADRIHD